MVRKKDGWTLTELAIVTAVVGLIVMIGPQILKTATNFFILERARLELQREARAAMYAMTREMRQAQSATIVIDQAAGQPYFSRLNFTKTPGVAVTISQSGSSLNFTEGAVSTVLTKNLAYLAFTLPRTDDMTIMTVSMTLQKKIYLGNTKALHMASERVRVMN
jgi:type II secretory pathway pseudopilin PulG